MKNSTCRRHESATNQSRSPGLAWTGGKIGPGQYEDFNVAFGQLPDDTDQLTFKALQTYSDGKVVRWIEEAQGGEEPENPAPVLKLTAKAADEGSTSTATSTNTKSSDSSKSTASASDSTARGLGIAGLVVGVLGLAAAAFAILRSRDTGARPE